MRRLNTLEIMDSVTEQLFYVQGEYSQSTAFNWNEKACENKALDLKKDIRVVKLGEILGDI